MIVVTVLAVIASIGVPVYQSALRTARTCKATQELRVIAQAIDIYRSQNDGNLPLTLNEVGYGGRRDPWGTPYCFLNYATGTGDGLKWAIDAGLVDPASIITSSSDLSSGSNTPVAIGLGPPVAVVVAGSTLTKILLPVVAASATTTDLVQNPIYSAVPVNTTRRRDKYLFPLNTDYDLFSLGPDAQSAVALSNPKALDDVIRANDGGFFGPASSY